MARRRRARPRPGRGRRADPGRGRPGAGAGGAVAGPPAGAAAPAVPRIALVDWLRGAALVAMTVFHFAYDLEFFGFAEKGYASQLHWRLFATSIAGSFLFLAGASLVLAHAAALRWRRWGRRLATVALAALAISVVTWFATPAIWIFFGILHMIAVGSVVALAFVRLPWWCSAAAAAAVFAVDHALHGALPDGRTWAWIGLSGIAPVTSDFRPVFPWIAAVLLGVAAGRWCVDANRLRALARPRLEDRTGRGLRFIGRHSLLYYLLHQPVLFALFWAWLQLAGR